MASNNVSFKISSFFQGEGFKNATKAIEQNRKEINSAKTGLGDLRNAFADISPGASKAVSAVENFTKAFVTGGIVGGTIQLAIQGIAFVVGKVKEAFDEAAAATTKYANIIRDNLIGAIKDANTAYKDVLADMQQANREADDLVKALNGDAAHEAQNKIFELKTQMYQQVMDEQTETGRQNIVAHTELAEKAIRLGLALEIATNNAEAQSEKVLNATEVYKVASERAAAAKEKSAAVDEMCASVTAQITQIETGLAVQQERFKEGLISRQEILEYEKGASLKLSEVKEKNAGILAQQSEAHALESAAVADETNARLALSEAQQRQRELLQKQNEAADAKLLFEQEEAVKRQEMQDKLEAALDKKIEQMAADELKALDISMKQDALGESMENLTNANNEQAEKLRKGEDKDDDSSGDSGEGKKVIVTNAKDIGSSFSVGLDMGGVREDIKKPRGLDDETYERIRNGQADIADLRRFDRYADRERRDNSNAYNRIRADSVKVLSKVSNPGALALQSTQELFKGYKDVLKQLPPELAKELIGDASDKVIGSKKLETLLTSKVVDTFVEKFCKKVKIQ